MIIIKVSGPDRLGGKAMTLFVNYILPRGKEKVQVVLFVREYTLQRAQNIKGIQTKGR